MKSILLFHPYGNNNIKHAAFALAEKNRLKRFIVGFVWIEKHWVNNLLPKFLRRELLRRAYPEIVFQKTKIFPLLELIRFLFSRSSVIPNQWSISLMKLCKKNTFQRASFALRHTFFDGVYGYDQCSLEVFKEAKKNNLVCIYELTTAHPGYVKKIYQGEVAKNPNWKSKPSLDLNESRVNEELALADVVIVPSTFALNSLTDFVDVHVPLIVNPYGCPQAFGKHQFEKKLSQGKLKVLYVGSISIMKGISYLLDAADRLGNQIDLTLVGMPNNPPSELIDRIRKYKWIRSLPNSEVLEIMSQHDVFVFPTLSDGFGMVINEALSSGLPVVATLNSGAKDVINEGENGFLIPIASSDAIFEKINKLNLDRKLLLEMSRNAIKTSEFLSWQKYHRRLIGIIDSIKNQS